jgi:hypothetical protein|tara:strand:- start:6364 stop:6840 length:477 start_codon:yes stop_codon:yes gene_type:complete
MSLYLKIFPFAVIIQLLFSELLTFNGYQANIMLLFVILSSMPLKNTSWSTINGFLIGLFSDFVLFSGVYIGVSSLVFSLCGFWSSKVSHNFAFRNFDLYWVAFVHLGVFIYSLFRYDYFFFNDFLLFLSNYFFVTYFTCAVGFILIRILSLKEEILNA